ncbi:MAG: aminopeptidase P family protein [Chloroflexi bacterium]|nr:aminopeptidase P family protein [Chloroflexota bacterium]
MVSQRVQKLRAKLKEQGLDALLVSSPENRRYLSGFTGSAGNLIISESQQLIATDFRYWEQMGRQSPLFTLVKVTGDLESWLLEPLRALGVKRLGFEAATVTFALYQQMKEAVSKLGPEMKVELVPTQGVVESLRAYKEPEELAVMQRAIDLADAAFTHVSERLRPGMTERQVAWELEKHMKEHDADGPSFDIIVGSGPNAALPHHRVSDRQVQTGEPIVIDMGAKLDGYCSDLTRTVCIGKPDAQFRKVYDIVLGAQLTAIATVRAKMSGKEGDALARQVIERAGYGEQFGHGLGHGIGLAVHEDPRVSHLSTATLEDGMVFTIEPGIYIPGWGGVRIEDIVMLENGQARDLTRAPKRELVGV